MRKIFDQKAECAGITFNGERLEKQFTKTTKPMSKEPDKPIPVGNKNSTESAVLYRIRGNGDRDREEIIRVYRTATIQRMCEYGTTITVNGNNHLKTEEIGYSK
jgi:hypothetical protein